MQIHSGLASGLDALDLCGDGFGSGGQLSVGLGQHTKEAHQCAAFRYWLQLFCSTFLGSETKFFRLWLRTVQLRRAIFSLGANFRNHSGDRLGVGVSLGQWPQTE